MRRWAIFSTLLSWEVFAPVLGAVACTAGILRLYGPNPPFHALTARILVIVCIVLGIYAVAVAVSEGRSIYKLKMAREQLTDFLSEGREFIADMSQPVSAELDGTAKRWANKVEVSLDTYLGQSYVLRFRTKGPRQATDHPERFLWWEIQERVENIEKLLAELDP